MLNRSLFSTFITLVLIKGLNFLVPILATPYLTRVLGAESYGHVMKHVTMCQYFILFIDFGYEFYGAREIALLKSREELKSFLNESFSLKMILLIISIPFFLFFTTNLSNSNKLILICYVLGNTLLPGWIFLGLNQMKKFALTLGLAKLLNLALIFLIIKSSKMAFAFPALEALSLIAASCFLFKNINYFPRLSFKKTPEIIRHASPLLFSKISISLYTITNPIIVGHFWSNVEVAHFVGLVKLIEIPTSMLNPINQTLFSSSVKSHEKVLNHGYLKKILIYTTTLFALGSTCLYWLFPTVVKIYLGKEFISNIEQFNFISIAPLIISVSSIIGFQYLLAGGKRILFSKIILGGSVVSIFLSLYLTPKFGIRGTLISYILTEVLISILMVFALIRSIRKTSL